MRNSKRLARLAVVLAAAATLLGGRVDAGAKEDLAAAAGIRLAAGACMASYSTRTGALARDYLRQDGWEIQPFVQRTSAADARFLLLSSRQADGQMFYMLAVVGTETLKDALVDLRTDKVPFAGSTPEEFAVAARAEDVPNTAPKVHRGFHEYVQAAFEATTPDEKGAQKQLSRLLLEDRTRKVYLSGHSLGGAAATLIGARLLTMGVGPEQVEVISFGAPAVGNSAFAHMVEPRLNLTRVVISGDPVTGVLQQLVGGYHQFGREIVWRRDDNFAKGPHDMVEYLDLAIKNYYDKREAAGHGGPTAGSEARPQPPAPIRVAPLADKLPPQMNRELRYMKQALADELRRQLPGLLPAGTGGAEAARAGGRLLVPEVSVVKLRNERNQYLITLQYTVFDTATGRVEYLAAFSCITANMTPLEAFIHTAAGATGDLAAKLAGL